MKRAALNVMTCVGLTVGAASLVLGLLSLALVMSAVVVATVGGDAADEHRGVDDYRQSRYLRSVGRAVLRWWPSMTDVRLSKTGELSLPAGIWLFRFSCPLSLYRVTDEVDEYGCPVLTCLCQNALTYEFEVNGDERFYVVCDADMPVSVPSFLRMEKIA